MSGDTDHTNDDARDSSVASQADDDPSDEDTGYSTLAVLVSAVVGALVTALAYVLVQTQGTLVENLYRVQPTIEGGGVGSDWAAGNTDQMLELLIAFIHVADVVMGLFILVIVFVHWAAFRRLAARMRAPGEAATEEVPPAERDTREGAGESAAAGGGGE